MLFLWSFPLLFFLFIGFFHPITAITQDLGRHLLTGHIIWQTHHIPKINLFSYTYPSFSFINHHWGSEVLFYLLQKDFGFNGLLIVTTFTALIAFWMLFLFLYFKKAVDHVVLLATSILYCVILFERTDLRPEIFSFFFLSVFIIMLYRYREHPTRWIFLLIPIEALWVNMHIYFFIGTFVISLFVLDWIVTHLGNLKTPHSLWIGLTAFFVFLVTIFNPNGLSGAVYPLHVFSNYGYTIEENQNIFFLQSIMNNAVIPVFELTVFLLFVFLFTTVKKTKPVDWFLSVSFSIISAMAIRNFPLFVFTTFIPFTMSASYLYRRLLIFFQGKHDLFPSIISYSFLTGIIVLAGWKSILVIQTNHLENAVVSGAQPAANFYVDNHIKGPVFNNFDIGSYLEYRIYPQKVFVDGRPEAYPAAFFHNIYIPMQQDQETFEQVDKYYNFNSIFFSHTDQTPWATSFIKFITTSPQWKLVYLDDTVAIYLKNNKQNSNIIKQYTLTQTSGNARTADPNDTSQLFQLAHFYYEAGWLEKELAIYETILHLDSKNCTALYDSLLLFNNRETPLAQEYTMQYHAFCQ